MDRISWLNRTVDTGMVYKHLVDTGIHSPLDIYFNTIPYHDAFTRVGPGFHKSIFKNLFIGFNTVAALRSNYLNKIRCDAGMFQFTMLDVFEAIRDQVKAIAFIS